MPMVMLILRSTLLGIFRDRVMHALGGVAMLLLFLVPVFSLFSMRQVQELAITLSFSASSATLLICAILLGASSIWGDVEKRYTASLAALPLSRTAYIAGKFCGITAFLALCALVLACAGAGAILIATRQYPSAMPVQWHTLAAAFVLDLCKYILVAAVAMLFSSLSTSFFLPFFGTVGIYLAGSASREVMEYIASDDGQKLPLFSRLLARGLYSLLPNFSAFDLKAQAIYSLPLSLADFAIPLAYGCLYTAVLLTLTILIFQRRELP